MLSITELKNQCPVKWHENIPEGGISLGVADVDFEGPVGIIDYLKSRMSDSFSFYQQKQGLSHTLETIRAFLDTKNVRSDTRNIQVIPGTMLGIYASMKLASNHGGKVVCAGPLYEPIIRHAVDTGNKIDFVPILAEGLDIEHMKESVNQNTTMIAINNPSNPTGYIYTEKELKLLRDLVVDNDAFLFSDELYEPLIFERSDNKFTASASVDGLAERTVALYGFSKAYGLAGYRSGFMYYGDLIAEELQTIVQSQLVSPSPFASEVCSWALTSPNAADWVSKFREKMAEITLFAANKFNENGFACNIPDGCFFVYPDLGVDDVMFTENLLTHQGIQVVPGSYFGPTGINHVRINCATSKNRLNEALDKIFLELEN